MALRDQLSLGLPLSQNLCCANGEYCQFGKILKNERFGSVAVAQTDSSPMAALGRKADTQLGGGSAFTNTGHSEAMKKPKSNGS